MTFLAQIGEVSVLWPPMLWLLAPVPILVWLYMRSSARQRGAHPRFAALAPAGSGSNSRLRRTLPPLLFLAGLTALIGSISRPQANMVLPSLHKDIILAIDISGSMRASDVKPDRLTAAQDAARSFIESRPAHSRIGIVAIAGSASVVQSPTDKREDLMQAIERLQLQRGTALGAGIYIALATLLPDAGIDLEQLLNTPSWSTPPAAARGHPEEKVPVGSNRSAAIVLLTDGESNTGPDPQEAAQLAAEHGVRIYTVGIGSPEGTVLGFSGWSMRVRLDDEALTKIAATTHGDYFAATSSQQLKNIYEHLSARMVIERTRAVEITALLVGLGAALLLVSSFFSVLWFNRVL